MILYLDTSAFVKLLVEEAGSTRTIELWLSAERTTSSWLLYPESRAALAAAGRFGRLDLSVVSLAAERLLEAVDLMVPFPELLRRAGNLAEVHALRGYDAVHLASAEAVAGPAVVFACADRRLRDAAVTLGLNVAVLDESTT